MEKNVRKDSRFAHIANDPRFKRIPKTERKVQIDNRFQSMFSDNKFKLKYTIDKRGRPGTHTTSEDLKRYYELPSEESSSDTEEEESNKSGEDKDEEEEAKEILIKSKTKKDIADSLNQNDEGGLLLDVETDDEDAVPLTADIKEKLRNNKVDYARGDGLLMTDSSSDEESSENESEVDLRDMDHGWGELDRDAERTDDVTNRLAVCNMDWDRIRASDLMVLFNSFLPPGGVIHSVSIYPSEYGTERMKHDEMSGPAELLYDPNENTANYNEEGLPLDDENEEGKKFHMEKLRQYQLTRLKYYYAVVVFDSPESANKIYLECDGSEYESSAAKLDLRFIPDDTTFDQEARESCDSVPDPAKYEPRYFTTTALQQGKVQLTWDETDPGRAEITKKIAAGTADDADLHAYIASSSGEDEPDEDDKASDDDDDKDKEVSRPAADPIAKYRALLSGIEEEEKSKSNRGIEMEVTWGLDLKKKARKLVKKKLKEGPDGPTPFQQMLEKRKENKKKKLKERQLKKAPKTPAEEGDDLYSDDDIPSDVDMNDPYFKEERQGLSASKKKKNRKKLHEEEEEDEESKKKKAELELLLMGDEDDRQHFSLKQIQETEKDASGSKKKRRKMKWKKEAKPVVEDNFEIDVKDDRFSALFSSHHFNIDPTDPHYRKTNAMEALRSEKLNRRPEEDQTDQQQAPTKKSKKLVGKDPELLNLVNSIKRKSKGKFKN